MQIERSSMVLLQISVPSGNTLANIMRKPLDAAPIGSPRRRGPKSLSRTHQYTMVGIGQTVAVRAMAGEPAVRQERTVNTDVTDGAPPGTASCGAGRRHD
jgi:hypothetical protein